MDFKADALESLKYHPISRPSSRVSMPNGVHAPCRMHKQQLIGKKLGLGYQGKVGKSRCTV